MTNPAFAVNHTAGAGATIAQQAEALEEEGTLVLGAAHILALILPDVCDTTSAPPAVHVTQQLMEFLLVPIAVRGVFVYSSSCIQPIACLPIACQSPAHYLPIACSLPANRLLIR